MKVKVVPRNQAIFGVLPKNKVINGPMDLDLNPREINYCMAISDVYDSDGNLLTEKVIEPYDGASTIIKSNKTVVVSDISVPKLVVEKYEGKTKPLPVHVTNNASRLNYSTEVLENGKINLDITWDLFETENSENYNKDLYVVIVNKSKNKPGIKVISDDGTSKKIGSKFGEFKFGDNNHEEWKLEITPFGTVAEYNFIVQVKVKDNTNEVLDELSINIKK